MVTVVTLSVFLLTMMSSWVPPNPFNLAYWHPLPPVFLYVPGSISVLTINMPSSKEVLLVVIWDRLFVHVPHFLDWNPASVGRMVIMVGASVVLSAMIAPESPSRV